MTVLGFDKNYKCVKKIDKRKKETREANICIRNVSSCWNEWFWLRNMRILHFAWVVNCCVINGMIRMVTRIHCSTFIVSGNVTQWIPWCGKKGNADGCEECTGICWIGDWKKTDKNLQVEGVHQRRERWTENVSPSRTWRVLLRARLIWSGGRRRQEKRLFVRVERSWSHRVQKSRRHVLLQLSNCREAAGPTSKAPSPKTRSTVSALLLAALHTFLCLQKSCSPTDRALCTCLAERFECGCLTELAID